MLINYLGIHPDVDSIIKKLYYNNLFPRIGGCRICNVCGDEVDITSSKYNLIYGDIIIFTSKYGIYTKWFYDLTALVMVDGNNDNFKVIINNVPINYWSLVIQGVNFDHTNVRKECIINIKIGLIYNDLSGIYTTFLHNDKQYRIIYSCIKGKDGLNFKKYLFTSRRKWDTLKQDFIFHLNKKQCKFYVPPPELDDNATLILNYDITNDRHGGYH